MRIAALLPCEAAVQDGRGAHVLVGANMNVRNVESFPAMVQTNCYILIEDEDHELAEGAKVVMRVSVAGPDGETQRVGRAEVEIGGTRYPELPGSMQFALPVTFEADDQGVYSIQCEVAFPHGVVERSAPFFVRLRDNQ